SIRNSVESGLAVLLFLDPSQDLAQALVLDNGGMADAVQLVDARVSKRPAFPANLQPPIRKVIDLDHFAAKANCQAFRLKRQLHATVVHHQLVRVRLSPDRASTIERTGFLAQKNEVVKFFGLARRAIDG